MKRLTKEFNVTRSLVTFRESLYALDVAIGGGVVYAVVREPSSVSQGLAAATTATTTATKFVILAVMSS